MKRALVTGIIIAAALAVAAPGVLGAQQGAQEKGAGASTGPMHHADCPKMKGMGMGMMRGMGMMGMGPGMGMMMGKGPWVEPSDADRGEWLVLQGKMVEKQAEMLKKQAEAMIAEGERLKKSGK